MPLDSSIFGGIDIELEPAALVLIRAREYISHGWTKHRLSRRWWGLPCKVIHPAARRFCALGAIYRAAYDLGIYGGSSMAIAISLVERDYRLYSCDPRPVGKWNDDPNRTRDEVLTTFSRAIRLAYN